jgi:hypothetical protein
MVLHAGVAVHHPIQAVHRVTVALGRMAPPDERDGDTVQEGDSTMHTAPVVPTPLVFLALRRIALFPIALLYVAMVLYSHRKRLS